MKKEQHTMAPFLLYGLISTCHQEMQHLLRAYVCAFFRSSYALPVLLLILLSVFINQEDAEVKQKNQKISLRRVY